VGTSAARKAPVGKFWRTAKTFASRFASGKEASPLQVKEVVARYLMALESHDPEATGGTKALLPDVVRTAASVGNFYRDWDHFGWETALESLGLNPTTSQFREEIVPALLDRLAGSGAKLEEAVARAALLDHFTGVFLAPENTPRAKVKSWRPDCPEPMAGVLTFLGHALSRKFFSDLGEPLEFQAPTINQGFARQEQIKSHILTTVQALATAEAPDEAFSSGQTTALLERLITHLGGRHER
jgi:hypothetical protein